MALIRCGLSSKRKIGVSSTGFSVIELMVLVALLSILILLSRPLVRGSLWNTELESASESLSSQIHAIRMKAVSQNASFRLNFDASQGSYQVEKLAGGVWEVDGPERFIPESLKVVEADELVFYSNGMLRDQGRIEIKNKTAQAAVIMVSSAGHVKVEKGPWTKGKGKR